MSGLSPSGVRPYRSSMLTLNEVVALVASRPKLGPCLTEGQSDPTLDAAGFGKVSGEAPVYILGQLLAIYLG